jgi:RNA polymerase sigma-70 factor (ECF subfamily)
MARASHTTGIEEEFLAAYDEYADSIFRFALSKTSDREVSNDLMQEAFTRAWDYCASGQKIEQWRAFLFRTLYNLIVDYYRKKRSVSLDAMAEREGFVPADDARPGITISEEVEITRVRRSIDKLDDTYRDILYLRFVEDLPVKEIARIADLSANAVSVRIHRGIQILRSDLGLDE